MLTAVLSEKTSARVIAATTVMMVVFSIVPFFLTTDTGEPVMSEVYLYTAIASGVLMVALSAWVVSKPTEKYKSKFKLTGDVFGDPSLNHKGYPDDENLWEHIFTAE